MCDPTSMTLAIFSGINMAIGGASTIASMAQGDEGASAIAARKAELAQRQTEYQAAAAKQQAEYQAKLNELKANSTMQQARLQQQTIQQQNALKQQEAAREAEQARLEGFQKLHSLGSHTGVRLDTGSPLSTSADILARQKMDEGLADYKSALSDWQADLDSGLTEWQGLAEANMGLHNANLNRVKGTNTINEIWAGGQHALNNYASEASQAQAQASQNIFNNAMSLGQAGAAFGATFGSSPTPKKDTF